MDADFDFQKRYETIVMVTVLHKNSSKFRDFKVTCLVKTRLMEIRLKKAIR